MLVGLRVLGETNWGPISQLTNMMQAMFAVLAPGNLTANMVASGTTGTVAVQSEAIMQDYKAGHIIGSTPRFLTYSQLIAAPIGAAAVALVYPAAASDIYGIGGDHGLSSPISIRIAGFAELLSRGLRARCRATRSVHGHRRDRRHPDHARRDALDEVPAVADRPRHRHDGARQRRVHDGARRRALTRVGQGQTRAAPTSSRCRSHRA